MNVAPTATVCASAYIQGSVTIGEGTLVHPQAKIIAENGPIVIGQRNIIEEFTHIINRSKEEMRIGDDNNFEVGSELDTVSVGSNVTTGAKAQVRNIQLPNGCCIGAKCILGEGDEIPLNASVVGPICSVQIMHESELQQRKALHEAQVEVQKMTLPKYHTMHTAKS